MSLVLRKGATLGLAITLLVLLLAFARKGRSEHMMPAQKPSLRRLSGANPRQEVTDKGHNSIHNLQIHDASHSSPSKESRWHSHSRSGENLKRSVEIPQRHLNESFVIMAMPRSGSTYLQTMLDSHPELLVYGEIFHTATAFFKNIHPIRSEAGMQAYADMFVEDHGQLCEYGFCNPPDGTSARTEHYGMVDNGKHPLCRTCSSPEADQARVVGFKALTGASLQRDSQVGIAGNALKGRKVVVLKRRNLLLRELSTLALTKNRAHILVDAHSTPQRLVKKQRERVMQPLLLDDRDLRKVISSVGQSVMEDLEMEKQARALSSSVFTVWYEDLMADEGQWAAQGPWRRLQRFLAVRHHPLSTPLMKLHNVSDNLLTQYPDLPKVLMELCGGSVYSGLQLVGATPDRLGCDGSLDALLERRA